MLSKSILIIQKNTPGPAGFSGGTPVSISLIPEGFTAKILFTKNRKNHIFGEIVKSNPMPFLKGQLQGIVLWSLGRRLWHAGRIINPCV